jgi:hypothetical protein
MLKRFPLITFVARNCRNAREFARFCGRPESWATGFIDAIDGQCNTRPWHMPDDLTQKEQSDFEAGFASACSLRVSFEHSQQRLLAAWLRGASVPPTARMRQRQLRQRQQLRAVAA